MPSVSDFSGSDRLPDLGLVRVLVDPERVLVGREQRVALLGDDRPDDHGARVHAAASSAERDSGARAIATRRSMAPSETTRREAPTTSQTPAASARRTATPRRLRNDLTHVSSESGASST